MKHKLIVVGAHPITSVLVAKFQEVYPDVEIVSVNEHLKNPFEPEPIPYVPNFKVDCFDKLLPKPIYENEPSKFISKPRHNFKRR